MLKKKWFMLAGLAIAIAAIVGLMVAPAMADEEEKSNTPPAPGKRCEVLLGKVADNLGITVDELSSAIVDAKLEMVDEALAEDIITEEQAERIKENIEENGTCGWFKNRPHRPVQKFGLTVLDRAVEEGIVTQEQADEVKAIVEQIKAYVTENGRPGIGPRDGGMLDRAVEEGIITREQADTIKGVVDDIRSYLEENGLPVRDDMPGMRGGNCPLNNGGFASGGFGGQFGPMGI